MRKTVGLILLLALFAVALTGCGPSAQQQEEIKKRDAQISQLQAQVASLQNEVKALKESQSKATRKVTLYFIKSMPSTFVLVPEERSVAPAEGTQLLESALKELIAGPATPGLTAVLPKDTKVLSVKAEKGLATVNLSKEATRLNVGSSGEALVVAAIANTLSRIGTVDRVQILIEGKKVETLAGHVDIGRPIKPNYSVVVHP